MIGTPEDTASGPLGSEGDVRRGSGFRRGRFPRRLAGILAVVAFVLFMTAWFSSGYLLERLAGRILPDTLDVSGVSVSWRGDLLIEKVQVSDAGGVWLDLEKDITGKWNWRTGESYVFEGFYRGKFIDDKPPVYLSSLPHGTPWLSAVRSDRRLSVILEWDTPRH